MKRRIPLLAGLALLLLSTPIARGQQAPAGQEPAAVPAPAVYDNPEAGLRFSCPAGVRITAFGGAAPPPAARPAPAGGLGGEGGPEMAMQAAPAPAAPRPSAPVRGEAYEVSVQVLPLPLAKEGLFGFTNHNVQKLRDGLKRGRIDGFPLNHQPLARLVRLPQAEQQYALENFLLFETEMTDIRFEVALDLFHADALIRIRISAAAFAKPIMEKYLGKTFSRTGGRYRWTTENHVSRFIQLARQEQEFAPVVDWLRVESAVLESIELY